MVRTLLKYSVLFSSVLSAWFLIRGVLKLSLKEIIFLATPYYGYHEKIERNLIEQKANTVFGFSFLMLSLVLQLFDFLWPVRWTDFGSDYIGVVVSIVIWLIILFLSKKASHWHEKKLLRDIVLLKKR